MKRFWGLLCCVAVAACGTTSASDVEVYEVKRGEFRNSVTVTGELSAVHSTMIQAPSIHWRFGQLKIAKLVEDGQQVEKDALLIQFDPTEVQKAISDAKAEVEIAKAELRKAVATHKSETEGLAIDLEIAKLDNEEAKLKLEQAAFEAEIDRKRIELDLENAGIALNKAEEQLANKRKVNAEEESKLKLEVDQAQAKLETAEETLAKLTVHAPTPGIAILQRNWQTREKFQVDDRTWSGAPMIGLPDLTKMQAEVEISEVDVAKITVGQDAHVRLDAFRDTSFAAKVTDVAVLARNKSRESKVKVFDAKVELDGADSRLMPGMTVNCEIVVTRVPDAISIPIEALFREENKTIVYVGSGRNFEKRVIETGTEGDNYVIVTKGLEEGEKVALRDPTVQEKDGEEA